MMYDVAFFERQGGASAASAAALVPQLVRWLAPKSLIDVGCGIAPWAAVALAEGVPDVLGVDGAYVDPRHLFIPPERFIVADLAQTFRMNRRFDVAICLEVAEHLPPTRGPGLVDDLCSLADVVVFSAAIPGQQGQHHVNLRWQSYWADLFIERGRTIVDDLRELIWRDSRVGWWYRQNLLVATAFALPDLRHRPLRDVVHPEATTPGVGVRQLLYALPPAVRASAQHRLGRLTRWGELRS